MISSFNNEKSKITLDEFYSKVLNVLEKVLLLSAASIQRSYICMKFDKMECTDLDTQFEFDKLQVAGDIEPNPILQEFQDEFECPCMLVIHDNSTSSTPVKYNSPSVITKSQCYEDKSLKDWCIQIELMRNINDSTMKHAILHIKFPNTCFIKLTISRYLLLQKIIKYKLSYWTYHTIKFCIPFSLDSLVFYYFNKNSKLVKHKCTIQYRLKTDNSILYKKARFLCNNYPTCKLEDIIDIKNLFIFGDIYYISANIPIGKLFTGRK